jgi:hypothetical protein
MTTDTPSPLRRRRWLLVALVLVVGTSASAAAYFGRTRPGAVVVFHLCPYGPLLFRPSPSEEQRAENRARFDAETARLRHPRVLTAALARTGVSDLGVVRAQPDPLAWLTDNLRATTRADSGFIRVELVGENEDELVAVLDALAAAYLADLDEQDNGARRRQLAATEERHRTAKAEKERGLKRINQVALQIGSGGGFPPQFDGTLADELRAARRETSELWWQIAAPSAGPHDALPDLGRVIRQEQLSRDNVAALEQTIRRLNEFRIDLERLKRTITEAEATEKKLAEEIETLKVELGAGQRVTIADEPHPRRGR